MWFEELTGFKEVSPHQVRENISLEENILRSNVNQREFIWGELESPNLDELKQRVKDLSIKPGESSINEVVANVQDLHADPENKGALFQVASQFNLLEMVSPSRMPEDGVGIYEYDHTQGPACAISAGAGTIYRNYFAEVGNQFGQTSDQQINVLKDLGHSLGNKNDRLWEMRNGYLLISDEGLREVGSQLRSSSEDDLARLRGKLRIGLQWNTQVTLPGCHHTVSQAYCSALPVAYNNHSSELWAEFASLILEASYEATICAAILNATREGSNRLYLTLLGGGAFGNRTDWIINSLGRVLKRYNTSSLEIFVVSYKFSDPSVRVMINEIKP
jgi:hypothetical protein